MEEDGLARISSDGISETFLAEIHEVFGYEN